jgi:predicted dehydrogenase
MPLDADPVPKGLHWDGWVGPAPFRGYKKDYYHPVNWRGWFDFGNGVLADFGCHNLNLPFRALNLNYPTYIASEGMFQGLPTYPGQVKVRFDFEARGDLPALTLFWYDGGRLPATEIVPSSVISHFGGVPETGTLLIGEKGFTFGDAWKGAEYIQLNDESSLSSVFTHAASASVPVSLPRVKGHLQEWVDACAGGPPPFSNFESGGFLTEIALAGVLSLRMESSLVWNGEKMAASNVSVPDDFIKPAYRKYWKFGPA